MGEFALYGRERIKIGTCENMYYLRWSQARQVRAESGSVDPIEHASAIRFRFPFPDEDGTPPGAFEDFNRGVGVDVAPSEDVEHSGMQWRHEIGNGCFLAYMPCPYSTEAKNLPFKIHGNPAPSRGTVEITQQRCVNGYKGVRMLVVRCSACHASWRLTTLDDALSYVSACIGNARKELAAKRDHAAPFWVEMARRILEGYAIGEEPDALRAREFSLKLSEVAL